MWKLAQFDLSKPVKKHVSSIHISNNLSLLQRKAFNILLLNAYDKLLVPGATHTVDLDLFCSVLEYESTNYPYLKNALKALQTKLIEWDLLDEGWEAYGWRSFSLMSYFELNYSQRTITYEIPAKLAKELYNPDIFAYLNLSIQGAFSSKYALSLYENCVRFRGVWSTGFIELATWRKLLGATGSSYDTFKIFNHRILKPAITEVNKVSDIEITDILFKRDGRRITHIKFTFESTISKGMVSNLSNSNSLMQTTRYQLLIDKGMEKPWALMMSEEYTDEYIQEKAAYTDKAEAAWRIKTTYQKFLYSAIKHDYKDKSVEQKKTLQAKYEAAKTQEKQQDKAAAQQRAQTLKNKRENAIRFEVYRQSQPETVIESIDNTAFQTKKGQLTVPHGHQSPSKAAVTQFLKEYYTKHILADYTFTAEQTADIQRRLNQGES